MADVSGPALDHVTVCTTDVGRSIRFYDAALQAVGLSRRHEWLDEEEDDAALDAVAYGVGDADPVIWVVSGPAATRGAHLCFRVSERGVVERFHRDAVAAGGVTHSAPRRWPLFRVGEFNAVVADPDGNLIEVVAPE